MGWTVWYQLVRDTAPSRQELVALASVAATANQRPWDAEVFQLTVRRAAAPDGIIVDGANKISPDVGGSDDATRMVAAINAVLDALPGAALRVHDDLGVFGVEGGRCSLDADPAEAPTAVAFAELAHIAELVPPRVSLPATLEKALATRARGAFEGSTARPTVIAQAMSALDALGGDDPRRPDVLGLLEAVPPVTRAQVGIERYAALGRGHRARAYLGDLLASIEDVTSLVPAFLAAWCAPTGTYYYGDLPWTAATRDRLAAHPDVVARMEADLASAERDDGDEELPWRRAEHACDYLGRSSSPHACAALIELVRRWRHGTPHWRIESYLVAPAVQALGAAAPAHAFATLALSLAGASPLSRARDAALAGIARIDPLRALPILRRACAGEAGMRGVVTALTIAGTADARALLESLRGYPLAEVRGSLGLSDSAESRTATGPSAEELLTHRDAAVRLAALDDLIERGDRSLFVTLVHADALHQQVQRRFERSIHVPGWRIWRDQGIVPDDVLRASFRGRLTWAEGDGAAILGPQRHLDAMEPARRLGVAAAAATYPDPRISFSDDERAALVADEEASLLALRT
jgi:hypothetical protein